MFFVPVDEAILNTAVDVLKYDLHGLIAEPLDVDDLGGS
jgi:hypothetical protein